MGMAENAAQAALLGRTYFHTVTAYRPTPDGEVLVCEEQPCALSRRAHTTAPQPADMGAVLPEALYRCTLFTFPALHFRLGDRLEVSDGVGVYHGRASDSFRYPDHCVTVMEILETADAFCPKEVGL